MDGAIHTSGTFEARTKKDLSIPDLILYITSKPRSRVKHYYRWTTMLENELHYWRFN